MPQPKSKSSRSKPSTSSRSTKSNSGRNRTTRSGSTARTRANTPATDAGRGLGNLAEQLANNVLKPLDMVLLTRERIQATRDEAAERGRVTRTDANELVSELVRRGRQQTDDLLSNIEQLVDRGREQLGSATRRARRVESVDRIVRNADRARRTVGVGPTFPILGYGDLTSNQVEERLDSLTPSELRRVRDYERRHANRKSVLEAIERRLG